VTRSSGSTSTTIWPVRSPVATWPNGWPAPSGRRRWRGWRSWAAIAGWAIAATAAGVVLHLALPREFGAVKGIVFANLVAFGFGLAVIGVWFNPRALRGRKSVWGKAAAAGLKCHAKALRKGTEPSPACLAKAATRLSAAFATAEARGGCTAVGDDRPIGAAVQSFVGHAVAALGSL